MSIFLTYAAFLQPTADQFMACAEDAPSVALIMNPYPADPSILPGQLVEVNFGETGVDEAYVYQVDSVVLQVIVNRDNLLSRLSNVDLKAIFSGQQNHWDGGETNAIQIWTYPAGDALRDLFESVILGESQIASHATIAPDPRAILEAVAADPAAIGYIPDSWITTSETSLSDQVQVIDLDPASTEKLTQPILVQSDQPPTGVVQELIYCLQVLNSINP